MKTIIAGSRSITDYRFLLKAISLCKENITEIISGHARGVDQLGERYAKENNIPLSIFPAQWDIYGKSAGYKRNVIMAEHGDFLIALWDGKSRGTGHMIDIAKEKGLKVFIHYIDKIY